MKNFKKICKMPQHVLKSWLKRLLIAKYEKVIDEDGFLYAEGDGKTPILLTAHMDTVHKEQCKDIVTAMYHGKHILTSKQGIGGDDRCGVWIIWMILTKTKYRPSVLFCEDEEIGGVGSAKFVKTKYINELKELKYFIELDRANNDDAVYYSCGNLKFQRYIKETTGFIKAYGSFSDISHLSPATDVASVNLSCGYYKAHTTEEYVIYEEMFNTFKVTKNLLSKAKECEAFDYQEEDWGWDYGNTYSKYGSGARSYYDYSAYNYAMNEDIYYEILWNNRDTGKQETYETTARNEFEAIGYFMYDNPNACYVDIIEIQYY